MVASSKSALPLSLSEALSSQLEADFRRLQVQLSEFFRDDFFGGYEATPVELPSNVLTLSVLRLPGKKPEDFKGAVGDFNLNVEASPSEVKVGDPVTLKMIITGSGNFNTVTGPSLKQSEDFKTYEPQVKQEGGKKIFEQVFIPMTDAVKKLPEVLIIGNTSYNNPHNPFMVPQNYAFVTNVFNPLFGRGPSLLQNISVDDGEIIPTLKEVIERLFTSRLLKVIFTTETFALGINMPSRSVIFDGLRKFYGTYVRNLKTRDFYQMAGRAGRRRPPRCTARA